MSREGEREKKKRKRKKDGGSVISVREKLISAGSFCPRMECARTNRFASTLGTDSHVIDSPTWADRDPDRISSSFSSSSSSSPSRVGESQLHASTRDGSTR